MKVHALPQSGNSAKFEVQTAKGKTFVLAFSFTLRTKIWQMQDADAELAAAKEVAEAIVGRHDPALPFKSKYIFAEHNTQPTLDATIKYLRRTSL